MSSINLTDLQIAGNEFFADAEGFLSELQTTELTTKELKQTHGGGVSGGITINGQILFSSGGGKKSKGGGIFFYTNGTGPGGQILFSSGGGKKSKGGGIFFYTDGTGQYSGC